MSIKGSYILGIALAMSIPMIGSAMNGTALWAQAPAATSQLGTVKSVADNSLTIATATGAQVTVTVPEGTPIKQVAPGSTNLSSAQTITLTGISAGDKVLVSGKSGTDAGSFSATRVILMKSTDIAQKQAGEQADWQKRGTGGIVTAVDAGASKITISAGSKKTTIDTTGATIYRRYADDSIKFQDAKPGTLAQIKAGDQLQVRGNKTADGTSIQAEEIVSGAFRNLSGTLTAIDVAAKTVSLKDLTTKKMVTVAITSNSDLRNLPPEIAARFAARERGAAGAGAPRGASGAGEQAGAGRPAGAAGAGARPAGNGGAYPGGGERGAGSQAGEGSGGPGGRAAGMQLSKMLANLPKVQFADLHTGEAVMIVASQSATDATTAVTLLSGVEPILTATPSGSEGVTLSPFASGGGAGEAAFSGGDSGGAPQ